MAQATTGGADVVPRGRPARSGQVWLGLGTVVAAGVMIWSLFLPLATVGTGKRVLYTLRLVGDVQHVGGLPMPIAGPWPVVALAVAVAIAGLVVATSGPAATGWGRPDRWLVATGIAAALIGVGEAVASVAIAINPPSGLLWKAAIGPAAYVLLAGSLLAVGLLVRAAIVKRHGRADAPGHVVLTIHSALTVAVTVLLVLLAALVTKVLRTFGELTTPSFGPHLPLLASAGLVAAGLVNWADARARPATAPPARRRISRWAALSGVLGLVALDLTLLGISIELSGSSCGDSAGFFLSVLAGPLLAGLALVLALLRLAAPEESKAMLLLATCVALSPFLAWYLAVVWVAPDQSWFLCPS